MNVLELTIPQKDSLFEEEYFDGMCFNPIQDADSKWIISLEERDLCDNLTHKAMVDSLPEITWNPPVYDI